jgi:hypothetical protein
MRRWVCLPRWRIPALLLLFTLFFYWKVLFTNRVIFPWDAADFFYPALSFVHEELRHFRLPLWNPYWLSGFPAIADPESQIFYPPTWLMVLAHPLSPLPYRMVEIQIIAHFFLAGLFMYYLAKDFTGHALSAFLGGVLFMSSGAMVAHTEHLGSINAMAWFPLVFLLARRGLLEGNLHWTLVAGFLFGIVNLTGHWQHAVYLGLLLLLYFAYEACAGRMRSQLWPRWIVQLSMIVAVGAGLAMVQILPTAELGPLSIRSQVSYWDVTAGNDPRYLWTLFLPNFFGGINGVPYVEWIEPSMNYVFLTVPGCLLALVGLIEMARRRNFFWLGLILVCSEISFGRSGYLADLLYHVPVLNLFRHATTYFDLANFGLCLMAAVGAHALFDPASQVFYRKWLPFGLVGLLLLASGIGLALQFAWTLHGWYHMLAVLALSSVLITALLRNKLRPRIWQLAILGVTVFELCQYNMNQKFNWSLEDPRAVIAYDSAAYTSESLRFLRSDTADDYRVAAFDGSPWGSNGCNVWRIRCTFGWNPIMLQGYQDYLQQFLHLSFYAFPNAGPDHDLDSPLLDLLGVKYLVVTDPFVEEQRLAESNQFEKVFAEREWRSIYQDRDYLSRAWFYPRAYVLADRAQALALMTSGWFQARRTLLFAREGVGATALPLVEELHTITIHPDQVAAASSGRFEPDPFCARPRLFYGYWGGTGSWIRFDVAEIAAPGRYVLLAEYASPEREGPLLSADVVQGDRKQSSSPVVLSRTSDWNCNTTRSTELGEFQLTAGEAQVTLTHHRQVSANLFTLWLVRLPQTDPPEAGNFSFGDFSVSANRIALRAQTEQDGYLLLNEIYYPGWEATMDGEPLEVLPADGIFRALAVPAGAHQIELRFRPRHLVAGAAVSLFTLALGVAYLALRRRRGAGKDHPPAFAAQN